MDLTKKPFCLKAEQQEWVKNTLDNMTFREKIGQLFCLNIPDADARHFYEKLDQLDIQPGGFMTRSFPAAVVRENFEFLQEHAQIPLLLAANLERGADGVCEEGTIFGTQMQIAATDEEAIAYNFGIVSAQEAAALGANWNFGPILDIDYNFHNPITNTRTFGSDPERVLTMSRSCIRGMHDSNMAVCLKHWPGDGMDERDQHMVTSVNSMTLGEWEKTYGRIYKELIDEGAQTVMSAHITLPSFQILYENNASSPPAEFLPATLSYELNVKLLRERLGFQGLIVTDATTMNGFMQAMAREKAVPRAIAAGCDMFLFTCNLEEDFQFMCEGAINGFLSEERLDEAVTRILALKAALLLPEKKLKGTLVPSADALKVIGSDAHRLMAYECADKAITLVKDTQHLLPLTNGKHKRILLHILGDNGGYHDFTSGHGIRFKELLEKKGFYVTLFSDRRETLNYTSIKISDLKDEFDLILYFANIKTSGSDTTARIVWDGPGAVNSTRYIHEIPTMFLSVDNPYHLFDVPAVKTYINAYTANEFVLERLVEKIMGRSPFRGKSPVDPYCGMTDFL